MKHKFLLGIVCSLSERFLRDYVPPQLLFLANASYNYARLMDMELSHPVSFCLKFETA
jgi:hypothetical protein